MHYYNFNRPLLDRTHTTTLLLWATFGPHSLLWGNWLATFEPATLVLLSIPWLLEICSTTSESLETIVISLMNLANNGIHREIYSNRGSRGVRDRGPEVRYIGVGKRQPATVLNTFQPSFLDGVNQCHSWSGEFEILVSHMGQYRRWPKHGYQPVTYKRSVH